MIYNQAKTFVIDHPIDPERFLVHACLEGPESGVYYRGQAQISAGEKEIRIELPSYVSTLADNFTVQLTQIYEDADEPFARLRARVFKGGFYVNGDPCNFAWHAYGTRQQLDIEPLRSNVVVKGEGPYKYVL